MCDSCPQSKEMAAKVEEADKMPLNARGEMAAKKWVFLERKGQKEGLSKRTKKGGGGKWHTKKKKKERIEEEEEEEEERHPNKSENKGLISEDRRN